ncbi:hypothetical protein [Saccharolobus islandicus]|uniref:Hypothetica protein n=1 Tax=Saccharolobus islandicus (strain L.D.8.5 / Lassen \|nr:hypothetical protein [Sulfolobus islandicus]ADB88722.1 hypothetica protein [Sulfolobus islandicus L.D.8.5]
MARLREETVGWLYTVSGLDEKSFPLGLKNVNMKELAVIFPLLMLGISFAFKNIMIAMAFIAPVFFFIFYEEKSMDEFQYVYHFMKFYLNDFLAPKEKKEKSKEKNKKENKKLTVRPKTSVIDYGFIASGALMMLISFHEFLDVIEMKIALGFLESMVYILMFAAGVGILGGEIAYIILEFTTKKISK